MKKKWKVILIISLILMVIEAGAAVFYVLPAYYKASFFSAIEETKLDTAEEILAMDFGFVKRAVDKDIDDYIVYHANEYLEGKSDYYTSREPLINIEHMEEYKGRTEKAFVAMNSYKLSKLYEDAAADYEVNAAGRTDYLNEDIHLEYLNVYHCESNLYNYYENFSAEYCQDIAKVMDDYLAEKYAAFKEGKLDYSKMNAYIQVAYLYFPETDYAKGLVSELLNVGAIDTAYNSAMNFFNSGEYVECVKQCDTALSTYKDDSSFGLYEDKLNKLRKDAYDAGKTAYKDRIKEMVDKGDLAAAKSLIDTLDQVYGKDINISELEALTVPDWKKFYKEFTADFKEKLKKETAKGIKAADTFDSKDIDVDEHTPVSAAVKDIDGDDIPELLLYNDSVIYVLNCDFEGAHLTGCMGYTGFSDDKLVAIGGGNLEDIYILSFVEGEWKLDKSFRIAEANDKKVYYIGSEVVTEDAYNEAKNPIIDKRKGIEGGVAIEDASTLFVD
ncbi:MAG: hypothetical protein IJ619_09300 [Eubacterium sp.]|nr:hypothetical protein [Eubacterium sp.]